MGFLEDVRHTFITAVGVTILGILSSVLISRWLGPEGRGIYTAVFLLPSLFSSMGLLGIGSANIYFVNQQPDSRNLIASNNLFVCFGLIILYALASFFGFGFLRQHYYQSIESMLYIYLGFLLFPILFFKNIQESLLRGMHQIKAYNRITGYEFCLIRILLLVLTLIVLKWNVFGAILVQLIINLIVNLRLTWALRTHIRVRFQFNSPLFKEMMKYGLKGYLGAIIDALSSQLDMLIIVAYLEPSLIGLYATSAFIANQTFIVSKGIRISLFPKISSLKKRGEAAYYVAACSRSSLLILMVMFVGLVLIGKLAIKLLYGNEFAPAYLPMILLLPGAVATNLSIYFVHYFGGTGRPLIKAYIRGAGLILKTALLFFLLPVYGIAGAALASSITSILMLAMYMAAFQRESPLKFRNLLLITRADFSIYKRFINVIGRRAVTVKDK